MAPRMCCCGREVWTNASIFTRQLLLSPAAHNDEGLAVGFVFSILQPWNNECMRVSQLKQNRSFLRVALCWFQFSIHWREGAVYREIFDLLAYFECIMQNVLFLFILRFECEKEICRTLVTNHSWLIKKTTIVLWLDPYVVVVFYLVPSTCKTRPAKHKIPLLHVQHNSVIFSE